MISIIVPIVLSFVDNIFIQTLIYWVFNVIFPNINAQAITTYILAQQSEFCKEFHTIGFSFFKSVGDNTMAWNWIVLVLHTVVFLLLLIVIDSGLLKFSFSMSFLTQPLKFDENTLDNDVLVERHRVLSLDYSTLTNKNLLYENNNEEEHETDHLTIRDLTKRFPGRNVYAVNHLTFGANRGEAFGLLGYNVSHTENENHFLS